MAPRVQNKLCFANKANKDDAVTYVWRRWLMVFFFILFFSAILWRAVDLQLRHNDFLKKEGNARHIRAVTVPAYRGPIVDRHGEPLAVTTPVDSVWVRPFDVLQAESTVVLLADQLGLSAPELAQQLRERMDRKFWFVQRKIDPSVAKKLAALKLPGVHFQREYQRFYPEGEVTAHLLGITDIDDNGQEGLELTFNDWLRGEAGKKRVIQEGDGHAIEDIESISKARHGQTLQLTIDRRIQYLSYLELKKAIKTHKAKAGCVVVLDSGTGEVLALASQPPFNPNNRGDYNSSRMRNRCLVDQFEPGSTIKPFTVAAGLESGVIRPDVVIDTTPGFLLLGKDKVKDIRNYGKVDLTLLMKKSSNVGASKIALQMKPDYFYQTLTHLGFGRETGVGFPGEVAGSLVGRNRWSDIERATFSFGYGFSTTALQLAQAYGVLANQGLFRPVSLIQDSPATQPTRVFSAATVNEVMKTIDGIEDADASARQARVDYFNIAGKTGTVRKIKNNEYSTSDYTAIFAGFAPVNNPQLVVLVVIDEPSAGHYYGGVVAAPVFSAVMAGALRAINAVPDNAPPVDVALRGHHES